MRHYQKFVRTRAGASPQAEQRELLELLSNQPAVRLTSALEPHPKGGYCVYVDVTAESLEELLIRLRKRGWSSVM